jgi:hypothetical protein
MLGLLTATCLKAAPAGEMPESRWHCRSTGIAMLMHWRQVNLAEGCDGEACRLSTDTVAEGVLMTDRGRRVGVVEVRGDRLKGWSFRDIEGRIWHLHMKSNRLEGTVASQRRKQPVLCKLAASEETAPGHP